MLGFAFQKKEVSMHISNCFPAHPSEITQDEEKKNVIDNAIIEVYKRLILRFPRREIPGSEIKFCGIKATIFPDGALGCSTKVGTFFTTSKESGYITTFSYMNRINNENYNLHTITAGTHFLSDDLKVANEYKTNVLNIAMEKLSEKIGRDVGFHEIAIIAYDEKIGYPKNFNECVFDEYITQKEEQQFKFEFLFEGNKHSFCFNVLGYDRNFKLFK